MKEAYNDDGRTVADMSMIEKPTYLGTWFGRRFDARRVGGAGGESGLRTRNGQAADGTQQKQETAFSKEDRRVYVGGAIKASLLIGGIYIAVIGAFIGILVLLWGK